MVTCTNGITVAHSGDQSWNDFDWIDRVHKDVDIDILMVNTWTADPVRLSKGLKPKVVLPGHVNEMSHTILGRIPFWKSYQQWKALDKKVIHLVWGEPYKYKYIKQ